MRRALNMKKFFKWLLYTVILFTVLVTGVLVTAYWNRDLLLEKISAQLSQGINGEFKIEKIDFTFLHNFPHFSVTLHNVYLRGNQYEKYRRDIFAADKIFADIRLYPLLKKEVIISSLFVDEANIFIFKSRTGYNNSEIFKTSVDSLDQKTTEQTPTSLLLNLQKIGFRNVKVVYSDSIRNKSMSFKFLKTNQNLTQTDSGYSINIQGDMHFEGLLFNQNAGSFLPNKNVYVTLHVSTDSASRSLTIHPSSLSYKKNEIGITGNFELRKEGKFTLKFKAKDVNVAEAKELLNTRLTKTLSKIDINTPITLTVDVSGESIPGSEPDVDVTYQAQNATVGYGALDFSKLTLAGLFTNHVDSSKRNDNKNSKVIISAFKGYMEKLPFEGNVTFSELQDPVMDLVFTSKLKYKDINEHFDNDRFTLESGNFTSEVSYKGKLSEYLDSTRTTYKGKLKGRIRATNVSLNYKPKKLRLDKIELRCIFNEKNFTIQDLNLNLNGSPISVKGTATNFIPFFIQPKNKGYVKLTVSSPNLDLTGLTSKRDAQKKSKQQAKKDRKKMTDLFDVVYSRLEFDVDLKINQLRFRKFVASNLTGHLKLDNDALDANPITMQVAGGKMDLDFSLANVFGSVSPMLIKAQIKNSNIKELFLNFNNFNQKTIQADNLTGLISADVKFNADVDENYVVLAPSMRGSLECKIQDGRLTNFEPMENMSNFLFKKRDFSDVQFAELLSSFTIKGTDLNISRMEIQSTVLSLFLEGRYSFTDSTSLSVQIPLSNLKKRHKDFKPKNIGTHAKAGPSVFLHVYRNSDINSKIKIDYDPFKKWAKN